MLRSLIKSGACARRSTWGGVRGLAPGPPAIPVVCPHPQRIQMGTRKARPSRPATPWDELCESLIGSVARVEWLWRSGEALRVGRSD